MKLMKIETVGSDAITANSAFYIDVDGFYDIVSTGATCVATGTWGTITFTFDGENNAEKLLNGAKVATYLADKINELQNELPGKAHHNLIPSIADFHTLTGIVHTGGTANTALISVALS